MVCHAVLHLLSFLAIYPISIHFCHVKCVYMPFTLTTNLFIVLSGCIDIFGDNIN